MQKQGAASLTTKVRKAATNNQRSEILNINFNPTPNDNAKSSSSTSPQHMSHLLSSLYCCQAKYFLASPLNKFFTKQLKAITKWSTASCQIFHTPILEVAAYHTPSLEVSTFHRPSLEVIPAIYYRQSMLKLRLSSILFSNSSFLYIA